MAKFAIECPSCGRYAEAKKGFWIFGTKKINCICGNVIEVQTDKLTSRRCPECGNYVAYDQRKAANAKCPVCKSEKISSPMVDNINMANFACPQCGCSLSAGKSELTYNCPICDMEIDVQERIKLSEIAKRGIASVIKYEGGNNVFVWKHPVEDFNIGSQLIVHESQEAIFFRNGKALDLFPAGRYSLETESIPYVNKLYNSALEPKGVFHSEIYYVNMATQMGIKWGTDSKVRFIEPLTKIPLEIGACGEFNIRVSDSRKLLLKLVGTESELDRSALMPGDRQDPKGGQSGYFRAMIMTRVKTNLAKAIKESQIDILEIDEHLEFLSAALRTRINEGLDDYGLTMPEFFVTTVVTPDEDENFIKLKQQHADLYLKVQEEKNLAKVKEAEAERKIIETRTGAQLDIIEAQGGAEVAKIAAQADAEAHLMKAEAETKEMQMKGYTYAQETQRKIGLEAMQGGIVKEGGGASSGLGEIVGLGVALGTLGGVAGFAKDAIAPIVENASDAKKSIGETAKTPDETDWDCLCGEKGIKGKFCNECGAKRPESPKEWICPECGEKNEKGKFCNNCGKNREEMRNG
ncbi:MAG: SPFH domain-containing protein [Oscillospiraceae bacterium]|nr:SPFH domain-containing protein [Oscillospiraceae bacterium]